MAVGTFRSCIFTSLITLAGIGPVAAADGTLVLDFGGNTDERLWGLSVGGDGRLYAVLSAVVPSAMSQCGMFALDGEGTLIGTFGANGRLVTRACGLEALVRSDNSFLIPDSTQDGFRISTFDPTGTVTFSTSPVSLSKGERVASIAQQADGKVLMGGGIITLGGAPVYTLRRWSADGLVDATFSGGVITIPPTSGSDLPLVRQIFPLSNGKFLTTSMVGGEGPPDGDDIVMLGRRNADGTPDFTFGLNGEVNLGAGTGDIVLDPSGRIYVLAGGPRNVVRVSENGTIDLTYVAQAQALTAGAFASLSLDSAGRAVVFAKNYLARFTDTGALDTTFGGTGEVAASLLAGEQCRGVVQPGDKPVIACEIPTPSDRNLGRRDDLALVRYNADGTLDGQFAANQPDSDVDPDAFSFDEVTAPYGAALVESNPITITGINSKTSILAGGARLSGYSVGCDGNFTTGHGFIEAGQQVCVRHRASTVPFGVSELTLEVGQRQAVFRITATNTPADTVPEAFSFEDQPNVPVGTQRISNSVQISGITGFSVVTVQGGEYSRGCTEPFTSVQLEISNGERICVRHTSSSAPGTSVATTLSVSGVTDTFTSTTAPAAPAPPPVPLPSPVEPDRGGGGALDRQSLASLLMIVLLTGGIQILRRYRREVPLA